MTEKETLMYQIMSEISKTDAPIVFKGAMIAKLILAESGFTLLERQTRDIDANWVGTPPSMDDLVNTINKSLGSLKSSVLAVAFREYGDKMSAGISIREKQTNEELISMDIDMRPVYGSKVYQYGEVLVKGVLVNEILTDKISVLSDKMIFRRAKDMLDVYALTHCITVNTVDVYDVLMKKPDRVIGAFNEFINRRQDIEHAYNKLRGVENKPPFDHIYLYLEEFLQPFIAKDMAPQIWENGKTWTLCNAM